MNKKVKRSEDFITHIADLANLKPKKEEADTLKRQVESTIEYISKLGEVDTTDIPITSQVTGLTNVFRDDRVDNKRVFSQGEALSNAKRTHKGFFVVNAIFDSES